MSRFLPSDRRLRWAVALALAFHWPLVAAARYRRSFDAYVHLFFADHYRRGWWSLWEPRWYTGFSVTSYPPLVHQAIALLSFPLGLEVAGAVLLLALLVALPAGVYAFARIFVGRRAAGYAALAAPLLPGLSLTAHTFGQIPTLAGLLAALAGLAALDAYLRRGRGRDGFRAVALTAVVAAAHHGTLLFLPWGMAAVALHGLLLRRVPLRRGVLRLAAFGLGAALAVLLVVWPFWRWGLGQTIQTPIDHPSRHSFLRDPSAMGLFFWPVYGPLVLLLPWALGLARRRRRLAPALLLAFLFVLGLGGTTPLPRRLYGRGWAWLTYDRFALWAAVTLLPFVGLAVLAVEGGRRRWGRRSARRPSASWATEEGGAAGLRRRRMPFPAGGLFLALLATTSSSQSPPAGSVS